MIDRALLIKATAAAAGTAASGLVSGLLLALMLTPAVLVAVMATALLKHGTARNARWGRVSVVFLATILLSLSIEFAGDEPAYWYRRAGIVLAFFGLFVVLVALPITWWRGQATLPRPMPLARQYRLVPSPGRTGLYLVVAAGLLGSAVAAALLKHRVYPEPLFWSATETAALAAVAAPFAWLFGRLALGRRRGTGVLVLAATVALSGWLSLAARPLLISQTTAAMLELAALLGELRAEEAVKIRPDDRWRYGQCAPLVHGMSRFYQRLQASLRTLDDLEPVLTDESFKDARALHDSEARLTALRGRLEVFDAEVPKLAKELQVEVERAEISDLMRERVLAGLNSGLKSAPASVGMLLTPLLEAVERVLDFMKSRRGWYRHEGTDLVFDMDGDAARYNSLIRTVQQEQARVRATLASTVKRSQQDAEAFRHWAQDPFNTPSLPRRE